jgi:hypothetical protein
MYKLRLSGDEFNPTERSYPFVDGEIAPGIFVDDTSVKFVGQHGPIREVGVNGCQIDDMIRFARCTIEEFNKKVPCRENAIVITKLEEAELWLQRRMENRIRKGIEGLNNP